MGLAGPKDNTKISKDPRNTFWSKDTTRFGHQYLSSLGWTPGQNLGDTTSSYHKSGHITGASSTGVKIVLKDDNLGIGARRGAQEDECTGLLGLQGLLGRLNGDTKVVERVQREEDRIKSDWIEKRWGMRFVRGEVWAGEDFSKLKKVEEKKEEEEEEEEEEEKELVVLEVREGKRKRDADVEEKVRKGSKKSKPKGRKQKKQSKDNSEPSKRSRSRSKSTATSTTTSGDETESKEERRARRRERRERREARRKEKAARREERRKEKASSSSDSDSRSESESETESSAPTTRSVTPASAMNGRHALRARFIAAKRSAMLDATSLNEILMIKA